MSITHIAPLEVYMLVKDAELLRRLIETKRLSARALSKRMGWSSHSYLNRILSGEVRSVKPDAAVKMAYILQVPVDLIFVARASSDSRQIVQKKSA